MSWSGVGRVEGVYWRFRSYLPFNLRVQFDSLMLLKSPEEKQLRKIQSLGEDIGLSSGEMSATYKPPLNLTHWRSRYTPFSACVMIIVIFTVGFVIIAFLALNDPNYFPPPDSTYRYGSMYGTIKPQDFSTQLSTKDVKT